MKLIRKLGTRKDAVGMKTHLQSWGLFECPYCKDFVKRQLGNGRQNKSCGCVSGRLSGKSHETHGDASHNSEYRHLYHAWMNMKGRCYNPNHHSHKYYGGRGIVLCNEWLDYATFKKWALAKGYKHGLELDRQDNDKEYGPANCRYVTGTINRQNQSNVKLSPAKVISIRRWHSFRYYSQKELALKFNVCQKQIYKIIKFQTWANVCPGIIN